MSYIEQYYQKQSQKEKSLKELILEEEENDAWDQIIFSKEQYIQKRKESKWIKREVRTLGNYQKQRSHAFKSYQEKGDNQLQFSQKNNQISEQQDPKQKLLADTEQQNYWQQQADQNKISEYDPQYEESNVRDNKKIHLSNIENSNKKTQSKIEFSKKQSTAKSYVIEQYIEYKYRWVNSFVYLLAALVQGITVHTFTPIGTEVQRIYKIEPSMVTLPALMFMIVSPPTMFLVNFISDRFGIKIGTSVGGIMLIVGSGLKLFINDSYALVVLGQAINGMGNSFIMNCPTKVASNWYKPVNRGLISIIFSLSITISPVIGVVIPPLFVNSKSNKDDIFSLILFEFIVTATVFIAMLIFFKESPPSPPSFSATMKRQPFGPQLKQLFTNKSYYLLLTSMGFLLGGFASFVSVISFYVAPYKYTAGDTSIFVIVCTLLGIVSSSVVGIYVKKTKKLKFTILLGLIGVSLSFGLFQLVLEFLKEPNVFVVCIPFGLIGICAYPAISTILELGAEIAFPVAEATITGFLFAAQQLIGFLMGLLGSALVKGNDASESFQGYLLFQLEFIISVLAMVFIVEDFKRTRGEIKGSVHMDKKILDMDEDEVDQLKEQLVQGGVL